MPQRLTPAEKAIAGRLREFRMAALMPQTKLAARLGIHRQRWVALEKGKIRLRCGDAKALAEAFRVNPEWLASGEGKPDAPFEWPDGISPEEPFLRVYEMRMRRPSVLPESEENSRSLEPVDTYQKRFNELLSGVAALPPEDQLAAFESARFSEALDALDAAMTAAHQARDEAGAELSFGKKSSEEACGQSPEGYFRIRMPTASLELSALLSSVRRLTTRKGSKTSLAKAIGVSPKRISKWLKGNIIPGGNHTLSLQKWVQEESRRQ